MDSLTPNLSYRFNMRNRKFDRKRIIENIKGQINMSCVQIWAQHQVSWCLGHGGVVGISASQPSKRESEGREFESRHVPKFISNMLAPRDLSICLWNGLQLNCKMVAQRAQVSSPVRRQIDTSITYTDRYSYKKSVLST